MQKPNPKAIGVRATKLSEDEVANVQNDDFKLQGWVEEEEEEAQFFKTLLCVFALDLLLTLLRYRHSILARNAEDRHH